MASKAIYLTHSWRRQYMMPLCKKYTNVNRSVIFKYILTIHFENVISKLFARHICYINSCRMNNELLDLILDKLTNKHHGAMLHVQAFLDENPEIRINPACWDAIKFLHSESYVVIDGFVTEGKIMVSPKGKLKTGNGGFSGEANYLEETLKVARQSKIYAFWGLIVGILSIALTIILSMK